MESFARPPLLPALTGFRIQRMGTYPKEARLEYLLNLLRDHSWLHRSADRLLRWSGLGGKVLRLDPRDQLKIYARRVS